MIPVIASFLPLSHPEEYLPAVFAIWEAFNSKMVDDRFIELTGNLSEEHVHGSWKEVGMFTKDQWTFLMSKLMATWSKLFYSIRSGGHHPNGFPDDWMTFKEVNLYHFLKRRWRSLTAIEQGKGTSTPADHSAARNVTQVKKDVDRQCALHNSGVSGRF